MNVPVRNIPFLWSHQALAIWLILAALVLSGCGVISPEPTASPTVVLPTSTPLVIVVTATNPATSVPTATALPIQPTAVLSTAVPPTATQPSFPPPPLPTATVAAPANPPPTVTRTNPATLRLKMFLVATGDNGASGEMVGCGDSLIPVNIDVPYTQGVLKASLEHLLAQKSQFYGESGLYNALYQSNLRVEGVNIKNGEAIIQLSGQVLLGGECDTPRVIGQIEATALQFSTVERVSITLNGEPIREALSLR